MIIYFILVILCAISIATLVLTNKKAGVMGKDMKLLTQDEVNALSPEEQKKYRKWEKIERRALTLLVPVFLLSLAVVLTTVSFMHHLPAEKDKILSEKSLIIYKAQTGEYEDNGDMVRAIDDFNDDLEKKKKALESPWTNWFVSRHYKDIEPINYTIDLEGVEYKN